MNFFAHLRSVEQEIEHDQDALAALIENEAPFERQYVNVYGSRNSSPLITCDTEDTARAVLHALRAAAHG